MEIEIKNVSDKTYQHSGRHFMVEMKSGKHSAIVVVGDDHVRVIVQNASNRCWKGMGRRFRDEAEALAYYRTPQVLGMIKHAAEAAKVRAP